MNAPRFNRILFNSWIKQGEKDKTRPFSSPWVFRNALPLTVNTNEFEVLFSSNDLPHIVSLICLCTGNIVIVLWIYNVRSAHLLRLSKMYLVLIQFYGLCTCSLRSLRTCCDLIRLFKLMVSFRILHLNFRVGKAPFIQLYYTQFVGTAWLKYSKYTLNKFY